LRPGPSPTHIPSLSSPTRAVTPSAAASLPRARDPGLRLSPAAGLPRAPAPAHPPRVISVSQLLGVSLVNASAAVPRASAIGSADPFSTAGEDRSAIRLVRLVSQLANLTNCCVLVRSIHWRARVAGGSAGGFYA